MTYVAVSTVPTVRRRSGASLPVRFARDQSVVRRAHVGADRPVRSPRRTRDEGGIAREVEQAQQCARRDGHRRRDADVRLWRQRRRAVTRRRRARRRLVQHLHRRAREPAGPGQHHGEPRAARSSRPSGPVWSSTTTDGCGRVHRRRRLHRVRRHHQLDDHAQGRLDLPRRHPGRRRSRSSTRGTTPPTARNARATPTSSQIEGWDALQATTDDAGNVVAEPAATEMSGLKVVDDRPSPCTLSAPFAAVAGDRRLQRLLPAARVLLRRPGGRRQAADRQRPVQGRRATSSPARASR